MSNNNEEQAKRDLRFIMRLTSALHEHAEAGGDIGDVIINGGLDFRLEYMHVEIQGVGTDPRGSITLKVHTRGKPNNIHDELKALADILAKTIEDPEVKS